MIFDISNLISLESTLLFGKDFLFYDVLCNQYRVALPTTLLDRIMYILERPCLVVYLRNEFWSEHLSFFGKILVHVVYMKFLFRLCIIMSVCNMASR